MSTEHITLPTIQASLGVPVTGKFIEEVLEIAPVATDKRAKFWSPDQYEKIRKALALFIRDRTAIIEGERPAPKPKAGNAPAPSPAAPQPGSVYEDDDEI